MRYIDTILNRFTTYRIVLYLLIVLLGIALTLSFFHILSFNPVTLATNSALILISGFVSNLIFSKIFKAAVNFDSVFITIVILILISPVQFPLPFWVFIIMSCLAMGGKYIFTYRKRHIFNPAALSVFLTGIVFPNAVAIWWVGNSMLFIPSLIISFLIIRKTRKFTLVFTFLGIYLLLTSGIFLSNSGNIPILATSLLTDITASALIFFSCVMLTEPLTSPSRKKHQVYYAALAAALYASTQLKLPGVVITAELALLFGNIFSFIVSPKYRLSLSLIEIKKLSSDIYTFVFKKEKEFNFLPGQYMEWTLPHKSMDTRGNRRYFTIASSPTEDFIMISIRKYNPSSSFKTALLNMKNENKIIAAKLSGDFVMPKDFSTPLVFVSGGIGITPFRSMLKYITDKKIQTNIILMYVGKKEEDFIFMDVIMSSKKFGVKLIKVVSDYSGPKVKDEEQGRPDHEMIKREIPDYGSRVFYISGPQIMVQNITDMLKGMNVKKIKTDFFPGYNEK